MQIELDGRRWFRRGLAAIFGPAFAVAAILSGVDSWRRRGKKRPSFPTTPPADVTVAGDTVRTYTYGQDLYDDMLAAIRSAETEILLDSYIWKADAVGKVFKREIIRAAERGVQVHVIFDGFANLVVPRWFKVFPAPVQVLEYPVYHAGWRFFDLRLYGRNHRKLLIIDERVAFVGGFNIGAPYAQEWRDTHVRIAGPEVSEVRRAFTNFWNANHPDRITPSQLSDWDPSIRVQKNVPRVMVFPIRAMYLEALARARSHVWMTHAYFVPDRDISDAMVEAAQRGVDVRVLVPQTSNHVVADWLSRNSYTRLLEAGVRIFRYQSMMHSKTATADGQWSTIGTANIDRLSMAGNYEINVDVLDTGLASHLERIFETDLRNAVELTLDDWRRRGWGHRVIQRILSPLEPLI